MNNATRELIDKNKNIRKNKRLSQVELAKRCNSFIELNFLTKLNEKIVRYYTYV